MEGLLQPIDARLLESTGDLQSGFEIPDQLIGHGDRHLRGAVDHEAEAGTCGFEDLAADGYIIHRIRTPDAHLHGVETGLLDLESHGDLILWRYVGLIGRTGPDTGEISL